MHDAAQEVAKRIAAVIEPPARELVAAYFDPDQTFAGYTFERLGTNPRDSFAIDDLLALTLMDVALSPPAVRAILGSEHAKLSALLAPVRHDVDLWNASDADLDVAAALFEELTQQPGLGPIKAGKLMSRKRPRLIPVIDKHVVDVLRAPKGQYWRTMRDALAEGLLHSTVEQALRGKVPTDVPTLRLLDVAIWMRTSESDNARGTRERLGLDVQPRSAAKGSS